MKKHHFDIKSLHNKLKLWKRRIIVALQMRTLNQLLIYNGAYRLQSKIASAVIGMMTHRDNPSYHSVPVLLNGGKNTGLFELLWETVDDKMKEYDKMKSDYEEMRRQLEVVRENDTKSL